MSYSCSGFLSHYQQRSKSDDVGYIATCWPGVFVVTFMFSSVDVEVKKKLCRQSLSSLYPQKCQLGLCSKMLMFECVCVFISLWGPLSGDLSEWGHFGHLWTSHNVQRAVWGWRLALMVMVRVCFILSWVSKTVFQTLGNVNGVQILSFTYEDSLLRHVHNNLEISGAFRWAGVQQVDAGRSIVYWRDPRNPSCQFTTST